VGCFGPAQALDQQKWNPSVGQVIRVLQVLPARHARRHLRNLRAAQSFL